MRYAVFWIAATNLGLLAMSGAALADERTYPYHMMWGGGWVMAPVMMLIFLAVVVFVVVMLVRWLWPAGPSAGSAVNQKSALAILEERFARGEIEKEEFEEKKRVIGS